MPYLGSTPNASFSSRTKQDFTANGSTTAFTLSSAVASANDIEVFVGNVRQEPTDAYTVNGTTLTMSAAPATGLNFYVVFKGVEENSVVPADNSISTAKIADNSISTAKIANNAISSAKLASTALDPITLDSTNNRVGVGVTSPSARLEIGGMAAGEQALLIQSPRNDALSNGLARINITDSNCPFEGLLIDHAGTGTALVANSGGSGVPLLLHRTANSGQIALFYRSGANVGNISVATSSTSYNTSSDYRLKENVVDLTGASARVNQLDVKRFNFIADDTNTLVDGFLAHEVATVVPEAINGTHNEVEVWKADEELPDGVSAGDNKLDDDGNTIPVYQGIDQSKLVPLLTAALQEALSEIASLKTRVQSLEDE
jgi:hypothetical protein